MTGRVWLLLAVLGCVQSAAAVPGLDAQGRRMQESCARALDTHWSLYAIEPPEEKVQEPRPRLARRSLLFADHGSAGERAFGVTSCSGSNESSSKGIAMFHPHRSAMLNRVFAASPFQGALPERATYLFIGLDANYSPVVESSPVFSRLLDYLSDGVAFWKRHGVHHPFLLREYKGDGKRYHRTFARIGFRPEHADQVSFVEMLHVPTEGQSKLAVADLDERHLVRLRDAIEHGDTRHIFVPAGVAKLMRESSMFPWMPKVARETGGPLGIWWQLGPKTVYCHYHLSVYGKFEQKKVAQLKAIGQLLNGLS